MGAIALNVGTPRFEDLPALMAQLIEQNNRLFEKIAELEANTATSKAKGEKLVGQRAICKGLNITPTTIGRLFMNGAPIYKDDGGRYYCYTHEMDEYYKAKNSPHR